MKKITKFLSMFEGVKRSKDEVVFVVSKKVCNILSKICTKNGLKYQAEFITGADKHLNCRLTVYDRVKND